MNDCLLFYKKYKNHDACPFCYEARFEPDPVHPSTRRKRVPRKKLWYLPVTPKLQRMFLCPKTATQMAWHKNCEHNADELIHPACGEAWKTFDRAWTRFANEPRNVHLGLCTDGFNPFKKSSPHSIWPVFLTVYNLPPGMCMKQEYIFISMIISGPTSPGKNLDVMLRPLIEELDSLWTDGVLTYDCLKKQNFQMCVALMWTISDYPAYGMLSSWSTHGRLSCPYCMESSAVFWLPHGRKFSYFDCHRKFLPAEHPYRYND